MDWNYDRMKMEHAITEYGANYRKPGVVRKSIGLGIY